MTQWEACVLIGMFLWYFLCFKKSTLTLWSNSFTCPFGRWENRGTNKPGVKGTVAEVSSCILGLGGTSFALRSIVQTEILFPTEGKKVRWTDDLLWCICFPSSIKCTVSGILCKDRNCFGTGASVLCRESLVGSGGLLPFLYIATLPPILLTLKKIQK